MASSLKIAGLEVAYGRTEAVRQIDIDVPAGRVVCLIGANGAGKTSTMRAISGLKRPKAGQILLDGQDIAGLPAHRIAALGVLQVPEGRQVFAELTIAENLALGAYLVRDKAEISRRQERVLARFPRLRERREQRALASSLSQQIKDTAETAAASATFQNASGLETGRQGHVGGQAWRRSALWEGASMSCRRMLTEETASVLQVAH